MAEYHYGTSPAANTGAYPWPYLGINSYGAYPWGYPGPNAGGYGYFNPLQQPMNDTTALALVQGISGDLDAQVTGTKDGQIDSKDLQAALNDKSGKYTDEQKKAIQYVIENQNGLKNRLDGLDGKSDDLFSVDSVNQLANYPNAKPEEMSNTKTLTTLKNYCQQQQWPALDKPGLQKLADDPEIPGEVRAAAKNLLSNQYLLETVDNNNDGYLGISDFDSALHKPDINDRGKKKMSNTDIINTVFGYAKDHDWHKTYREDIVAITKDTNASPEQREAARLLLENKALMDAADTASNNDKTDGTIDRDDFKCVLRRSDIDSLGVSAWPPAGLPGASYTPSPPYMGESVAATQWMANCAAAQGWATFQSAMPPQLQTNK